MNVKFLQNSIILLLLLFVGSQSVLAQCTGSGAITGPNSGPVSAGYTYTISEDGAGNMTFAMTVVDNPAGLVGFFGGSGGIMATGNASGMLTWTVPATSPINVFVAFAGGDGDIEPVSYTIGECAPAPGCTGSGAITGPNSGPVSAGYTYTISEDGAGNMTLSLTVIDNPAGLVGFFGGPGGIMATGNASGMLTWTVPATSPINVFLAFAGGDGDIEPITYNVGDCAPGGGGGCTLTAAPCMTCQAGNDETSINIAALTGNPFNGGAGSSASFSTATNSGTVMLTAGTDGVFAGVDIGDFTLPDMVSDLCMTLDIDVVSGATPFNIEFRIEKGPNGLFQGGQALTYNATVDGSGACSIGGGFADGTPENGFVLDAGAEYSVIVAISNFSGMGLPEDVTIDISNLSFSYCAPAVTSMCDGSGAITGGGAAEVPNGYTYTIVEDGTGNMTVTVTVVDNPVGLVGFFGGSGGMMAFPDGTGTLTWTVPSASPINVFLAWAGNSGDIEPIMFTPGDCAPVVAICDGSGAITGAGAAEVPNGYTYTIVEDGAGNMTVTVTVVDNPVGLVGFFGGSGGMMAFPDGTGTLTWTVPSTSPINVFLAWAGNSGDIEPIMFTPGDCAPVVAMCDGSGAITGGGAAEVPNGYTYTIVEDGTGNMTVTVTVVDNPVGLVGFFGGSGGMMAFPDGTGTLTWTVPSTSPINVFLAWAGNSGDIEPIMFTPGDCAPVVAMCDGSGAITGGGAAEVPNGYTYTIVEDGAGNMTVTVTVVDNPVGLVGFFGGSGGMMAFPDGTGTLTWTVPSASPINVFLAWAGNSGDIEPIMFTPGDCVPEPVCTLEAAPCMSCQAGFDETVIDIAALAVVPFNGGAGTSSSFDPASNSGTVMLTAGTDGVFTGFRLEFFTLPENLDDLCITADIELVSGAVPFTFEFRIEKGGGPFGGGSGLSFNGDIDGSETCSVGGSLSDGMDMNGFTIDGSSDYSIVVAIANFSGTPLPEDVIINISNIGFTYCTPPPVCTISAGDCMACEGCDETYDVSLPNLLNLSNGPVQPNFTSTGTSIGGTLSIPAGSTDVFTVAAGQRLVIPNTEQITDICATADVNVVSGQYPFVLEFRVLNTNTGAQLNFNQMVDGEGMCSIGGSLADAIDADGFTWDNSCLEFVVATAFFPGDGSTLAVDRTIEISNMSLSVCTAESEQPEITCPSQGPNLFVNPGFDTGDLAGWTPFGGVGVEQNEGNPLPSSFMFATGGGFGASGISQIFQNVTEGEWYCIGADFMALACDGGNSQIFGTDDFFELNIRYLDANGIALNGPAFCGGAPFGPLCGTPFQTQISSLTANDLNKWLKAYGCFQAPAGVVSVEAVIAINDGPTGDGGAVLVDNATFNLVMPQTFEVNAADCSADVVITDPVPTDNCGIETFTNSFNGTDSASGNYPVGETLVTYIATDEAGNEACCSILIVVEDTSAPTITCPTDILVDNDFGVCGAIVNFDVVGEDLCDFELVQTEGLASGSVFPVGETVNTFVVTDASGLTAECTFTVTVADTEGPMIDCPNDISVALEGGECEEVVFFEVPFMDNCGTIDAEASQALNEMLVNDALDCANNTSNHLRYFASGFTVPIEITQVNFGVFNTGAAETVTVNVYSITPGAAFVYANMTLEGTTDFAVPAGMNNSIMTAMVEATIPSTMDYVLELRASNTTNFVIGYNNQGETGSTYISGNNPLPCVSLEPVDIDGIGFTAFAVVLFSNAEAGPSIEQTGGLPSGSTFPQGTTTNTFIVTDVFGNSSECTFDVILTEFEPFTGQLACNDNINISLDANCEVQLFADFFLEGNNYGCYNDYEIYVAPFGNENNLIGPFVGAPSVALPEGDHQYQITDPETGNSCWGTFTIESKTPPTIEDCDCIVASTVDPVFTGTLDADSPTFDRPSGVVGCTPVNVDVPYMTHDFQVGMGAGVGFEVVTFTAPSNDSYLAIYENNFNPNDPCTNVIATNDDGGVGFLSQFDVTLAAGIDYILVVTTFNNNGNDFGDYVVEITTTAEIIQLTNICDDFTCIDIEFVLNSTDLTPNPTVNSCSPVEVFDFVDELIEDECGTTTILRTWTATNAGGTATCTQEFVFAPIVIADLILPISPVELTCGTTDISPEGIVAFFDNPLTRDDVNTTFEENNEGYPFAYPTYIVGGHPQKVDNSVCSLYAGYTDTQLDACGDGCNGNFKVIRTWTLVDWCTLETSTFNQIIKVVDNAPPTLITKDVTISTDPWGCEATFDVPLPWELHDDCDFAPMYTVTGPAGVSIIGNMAEGFVAVGAPKGTHTFIYIAFDCCGNEASYPFTVTITDGAPPVAIAKQNIVVSLSSQSTGADGTAKVFAASIDNGSYDGCSDVKLEVRRMTDACDIRGNTTFNADGHSNDGSSNPNSSSFDPDGGAYVKFCCEDITNAVVDIDGDGENDPGYVEVVLRVWDDADMDGILGTPAPFGADNFNETWAYVKVENKLPPAITCPADVTLTCDMDYTDLSMTGEATAFGSCGAAEVEYSDRVRVNTCNVGEVVRRWNVVGAPGIFCEQTITIDDLEGPDPVVSFSAVGDFTAAGCPDDIALGEPTWTGGPCDVIGYTVASDTFLFEDGACRKLVNTYTVINWCTYMPNSPFWVETADFSDGIIEHTQVIAVTDETVPTIENCEPQMFGAFEGCAAVVTLENVAMDPGSENCPTGWLKWQVFVDLWADGTDDLEYSSFLPQFDSNVGNDTNGNGIGDAYLMPTVSGGTVSITLPEIAGSMSNHKVTWKVTDGCNNVRSCATTFMVVDKKAPTPYCVSLSTAVMPSSGTVELWAIDFNQGSFDNCTEQENLLYTFNGVNPNLDQLDEEHLFDGGKQRWLPELRSSAWTYTTADVANSPVLVNMSVWDEKLNTDFCEVFLTIVDNSEPGRTIAGTVATSTATMVPTVDVTVTSILPEYPKTATTAGDGAYAFAENLVDNEYTVTASRDINLLEGVNTLDLVKIQRHILGIELLDSPYKVVAADINKDNDIKASDLLALRKAILGVSDAFPNNESWRFLDESVTFADAQSPWAEIVEELEIMLADNSMDNDFIAVKVGDVDGSVDALLEDSGLATKSSNAVTLVTEDRQVVAGETVDITFTSEEVSEVYGYQFTLALSGLEYAGVQAGALAMDAEHVGQVGESVTVSYNEVTAMNAGAAEGLFTMSFVATQAGQLSDMIATTSTVTTAEAYVGTELETVGIELAMTDAAGTLVATDNELLQNEPNPFKSQTTIGFTLAEAGPATLSVLDVTGKVVLTRKVAAEAGYNQVVLREGDLNVSGVLYYQLESGDFAATKKMIVIE